jgi:hypothetical protein
MDIRTGVRGGYLTEKEMAGELGLCERTLARWRKQRKGPPFVERGRFIDYNIEAARAWLAAGGTAAAAKPAKRKRKG